MGYVLTEILPWIIGALIIGFIVGWLFWRGRCGTSQETLEELERLRTHLVVHEQKAKDLSGRIDQQRAEIGRLSALADSLQAEKGARPVVDVDGLHARIADLERTNTQLTASTSGVERLKRRIAELEGKDSSWATTVDRLNERIAELEAAAPRGPAAALASSPTLKFDSGPDLDFGEAERVLGFKLKEDDLQVVEGIGPKIAELCAGIGISSWRDLAGTDVSTLQAMLDNAGPRYRMHDPSTWPRQAGLLATGRWVEFKELTDHLSGGRK
jgi:predicted flap endonuclease-1-like 5' DNA nuclease